MKNKRKLPVTQTESLFRQAILCGAVGVFCWINVKTMWTMALFFTALCVFNLHYYFKHKQQEDKSDKSSQDAVRPDSDDKRFSRPSFIANHYSSEKQKQQAYNDYLDNLENEFEDFDVDEDDAD